MFLQESLTSSTRSHQRNVVHACPTALLPGSRRLPRSGLCPGRGKPEPLHVLAPRRGIEVTNNRNESRKEPTRVPEEKPTAKPRVVVLGSGWGAMSFVKALPQNITEQYEVAVLSPRNYFLYTPLLPAVATGTMEERSIVEPVRNILHGKGEYYEVVCKDIDPVKKELIACFSEDVGLGAGACFKMSYDVLVLSVGSVNNTFGIPGVDEHCYYFKTMEDANDLRRRITDCLERASLPGHSSEERKQLLSFVVVGAGPTGVEVAAELHDMLLEDLAKIYPEELINDVSLHLVDFQDFVLSTYNRSISDYTGKLFTRAGIKLVLGTRVSKVEDGQLTVVNKENETSTIPFGTCVWASGIAPNPLIKSLQQKIPGQTNFRALLTDDYLRVKGSNGSIFALGDASLVDKRRALTAADRLFDEADINKTGKLTAQEVCGVLKVASKEFHHLEDPARHLESKLKPCPLYVWDHDNVIDEVDVSHQFTKDDFKVLLTKLDACLKALPPTAQVAAQQGSYLANLFSTGKITGDDATTKLRTGFKEFHYFHKGSTAYVGQDKAVMDVPVIGPIFGNAVGHVWKGYETMAQFSWRNRFLVSISWVRTKIFGRDVSQVSH